MNASTSADSEIIGELRRNPGILSAAQQEAGNRYRQARALPNAPVARIDGLYDGFRRRMTAAAIEAAGANPHSERDQLSRLKQFKIVREAIEKFESFKSMSADECAEMTRRDNDDVVRAVVAASLPPVSTPTFDARIAIKQLAARGVTLSVGKNNTILATPSGALTAGERETLRAQKAALLAVMTAHDVVA